MAFPEWNRKTKAHGSAARCRILGTYSQVSLHDASMLHGFSLPNMRRRFKLHSTPLLDILVAKSGKVHRRKRSAAPASPISAFRVRETKFYEENRSTSSEGESHARRDPVPTTRRSAGLRLQHFPPGHGVHTPGLGAASYRAGRGIGLSGLSTIGTADRNARKLRFRFRRPRPYPLKRT